MIIMAKDNSVCEVGWIVMKNKKVLELEKVFQCRSLIPWDSSRF